jgi:hypothetical protein
MFVIVKCGGIVGGGDTKAIPFNVFVTVSHNLYLKNV